MITFKEVTTNDELYQILELQEQNHVTNVSHTQLMSQGFVTVKHDYELLSQMNRVEASIIAKDKDRVVGFCLAMPKSFSGSVPVLIPMFETFDELCYQDKVVADFNYIVVGQVCVAEAYRGKGVFDEMYRTYGSHLENRYDFAITEISKLNPRSLQAHKRVGFEFLHAYTAPDGDWDIVLWDWNKRK